MVKLIQHYLEGQPLAQLLSKASEVASPLHCDTSQFLNGQSALGERGAPLLMVGASILGH